MSHRIDFDLCLITDRHQTGGRPLDEVVEEALSGGVRAVQLREKDLSTRELLRWAEKLRSLTARFGARFLINDRLDVCLAVGADGVHLRADSLPVSAVRKILGPERLIGQSTHAVSEVIEAQREGADFVVLGPIYDTPSKRSMGRPPLGLSVIRSAAARVAVPVFAIGGIRFERISDVIQNCGQGVAVISALLRAPNPREAAAEMLHELKSQRSSTMVSSVDGIRMRAIDRSWVR
ncbi:MAG TPA: thiamine phosphate synthase [Nitrospiria bacterium]|nr:thiamine phosphate synthase [Nitrospiria bacterium]